MSKTAEKSSPTMDSRDNMIAELNSLYQKFEHRIEERSAHNRTQSCGSATKTEIENFNRLKLHRTKVKNMHHQLLEAKDQEWLAIREEAQTVVENAKIILNDPKPSN